ncbi:hypothetical protein [Synechococcus sp. BDU 130192]|uniref:hypothetical protein n=1 Tax=Synechococcus sp. BDU 130192 TaxID=2042059 RepID=UPI000C06BF33|nr:hypothetical protein [Synechococcus sp. BDU 130192]
MSLFSPFRLISLIGCTSLLSLGACQRIDPALYDCQKLLAQIQSTVTEAQTLVQNEPTAEAPQTFNFERWLQAADALKMGAEAIAQLRLRDSQMKTYQTQISDIYQRQAEATYAMVKARQDKDLEAAQTAQSLSQTAGTEEQTIGQALNDHCQAKYQAVTATEDP